ncbi:hypothetical protein FCM30_18615 [Lelliottia aquatilis]|uniref:helix-turn-helix transcriptional regulator n=1 Tax=Lelliottia aquatilis TaxID=2080838 RepID=UPI0015754630|nr:LuxR C-terminal-related transcriptional regulator [Lelliottia aquatilis]NTZ47755.1 hypothetical protein [Lelliottia aquatilis]
MPTPGDNMLIIAGECQYTLMGLKHLLCAFEPVLMSGLTCADVQLSSADTLLVVANPGGALPRVLPMIIAARQSGVQRIAIIGRPAQEAFFHHCGVFLDYVLPPELDVHELRHRLLSWTGKPQCHKSRIRNAEAMSRCEREILRGSLCGQSVEQGCSLSGVSLKTYYSHRRRALNKLQVRSLQALVASQTGIPGNPEHYARLLCGSESLI